MSSRYSGKERKRLRELKARGYTHHAALNQLRMEKEARRAAAEGTPMRPLAEVAVVDAARRDAAQARREKRRFEKRPGEYRGHAHTTQVLSVHNQVDDGPEPDQTAVQMVGRRRVVDVG